MDYPFFVYGTLKPGEPNYTRLLAHLEPESEAAHLAGAALYTAGPFPFLVMEPDLAAPADLVVGTLVTVSARVYAAVLADLDRLEGYIAGATDNLYERQVVTLATAHGPQLAWVYVAGAATLAQIRAGGLWRITTGNWQSDAAALEYWSSQ